MSNCRFRPYHWRMVPRLRMRGACLSKERMNKAMLKLQNQAKRTALAWLLVVATLALLLPLGIFPVAAASHVHDENCVQLGNVTLDAQGAIDIDDILAVRAHMFGQTTLTGLALTAADISKTGVIDIDTILAIRAHMFGTATLPMSCNTSSPDPTPTAVTATPTAGVTAGPTSTLTAGVTAGPTASPTVGVTRTPTAVPTPTPIPSPLTTSVKLNLGGTRDFPFTTGGDFQKATFGQNTFGWVNGSVNYMSFGAGEGSTNPSRSVYIFVSEVKVGGVTVFDASTIGDFRPNRGQKMDCFLLDGAGPDGGKALVWYFESNNNIWQGRSHYLFPTAINWPSSASGNVEITYRVDFGLPAGVSLPPQTLTVPDARTTAPTTKIATVPTFNRYALPDAVQDFMTTGGMATAYTRFVDAVYARQATITLSDLSLDSPDLFKQVVQCYMNYNALRHFFTDAFPTANMSSFTPTYRYDAGNSNTQHTGRINFFAAKVNSMLAKFAPVGANEMDVILACHLWVTTTNEMVYAGDGVYPTATFPYQDAYMAIAGATGNGQGYASCCGLGEVDAFLMLQCGINAFPCASYSESTPYNGYNDPRHYVNSYNNTDAWLSGGHGVCSFEYRGKFYLADPSEGRAITKDSMGDLFTVFSSFSTLNYTAFVRGDFPCQWLPLPRVNGTVRCVDTTYDVLNYQAWPPNSSNTTAYKVQQNIAAHTVKFPARLDPTNANRLFWVTYDTETENVVAITPQ